MFSAARALDHEAGCELWVSRARCEYACAAESGYSREAHHVQIFFCFTTTADWPRGTDRGPDQDRSQYLLSCAFGGGASSVIG